MAVFLLSGLKEKKLSTSGQNIFYSCASDFHSPIDIAIVISLLNPIVHNAHYIGEFTSHTNSKRSIRKFTFFTSAHKTRTSQKKFTSNNELSQATATLRNFLKLTTILTTKQWIIQKCLEFYFAK